MAEPATDGQTKAQNQATAQTWAGGTAGFTGAGIVGYCSASVALSAGGAGVGAFLTSAFWFPVVAAGGAAYAAGSYVASYMEADGSYCTGPIGSGIIHGSIPGIVVGIGVSCFSDKKGLEQDKKQESVVHHIHHAQETNMYDVGVAAVPTAGAVYIAKHMIDKGYEEAPKLVHTVAEHGEKFASTTLNTATDKCEKVVDRTLLWIFLAVLASIAFVKFL